MRRVWERHGMTRAAWYRLSVLRRALLIALEG